MRSKTGNWYIVTAKYNAVDESGNQVRTTGVYVVNAVSFGDAETKVTKELSKYYEGDLKILRINPAPYMEIFFSDNDKDEKYYQVSVKLITLDERTGKEKKQSVTYLVQGDSTATAEKNTKEVFNGTMIDYVVNKVAETSVISIYE